MTDRIREIAEVYAANAGEVNPLENAIRDVVRDEREACVKIVSDARFEGSVDLRAIVAAIRARKP
jgi:hypothetical protein